MKDLQKALQPYTGRELSVSEAITSGLPTLRKVELISGQAAASALVAAELIRLMSVLNFQVKTEMIEAAADGIAYRFPDVNTADLMLFRLQVQRGELGGEIYRIDTRTLVRLFEDYYERRQYEQEQIIAERQKAWMGDLRAQMAAPDKIREMYAKMKAEPPKKEPKRQIDGAALIEAEKWANCPHDKMADRGEYLECEKCKSIVYK